MRASTSIGLDWTQPPTEGLSDMLKEIQGTVMNSESVLEKPENAADLLALIKRLGGVSPDRVRLNPLPGQAKVKDLIRVNERKIGPPCELVENTLVEKAMGIEEDFLGAILVTILNNFILPRRLGAVLGAKARVQMKLGNVRLPDVAFVSAKRWRKYLVHRPTVAQFTLDLAVEVLSRSNTRAEMKRKRKEYFQSGTRLVWEINPRRKSVTVYTSLTNKRVLIEADTLDGGDVLPGFALPLGEFFANLSRRT